MTFKERFTEENGYTLAFEKLQKYIMQESDLFIMELWHEYTERYCKDRRAGYVEDFVDDHAYGKVYNAIAMMRGFNGSDRYYYHVVGYIQSTNNLEDFVDFHELTRYLQGDCGDIGKVIWRRFERSMQDV